MGTVIILLGLVAVCVIALGSIKKRIKYGSACCGTHDAPPKKIRVRDKNAAHYPYAYTLSVDGMHCTNCARRVENALNSKDGVWASVSLEKKSVFVRSKTMFEQTDLSRIVAEAGYTVIGFSSQQG